MCKLFFAMIAGLLLQPAGAQTTDSAWIKKISDEILTNGKAYENLRHLTKKIGARLAGSSGMVKAEQWGVELMKTSGADQAWLQEWVYGVRDSLEYWEKLGAEVHNRLKVNPRLASPVNYGDY